MMLFYDKCTVNNLKAFPSALFEVCDVRDGKSFIINMLQLMHKSYDLSSNGVLTKYVVRIPFPLTWIGPRHSHGYPAAIKTFAVFSVVYIEGERENKE